MDAICILGRGIERVSTRMGVVWRPTRYIERLSERGEHTGFREPRLSLESEGSVIAGANANVVAACQLIGEIESRGGAVGLVIFAAGRPKYLSGEADPNLTEGSVLLEKFRRKVFDRMESSELVVLAKNRDTSDDISESLELSLRRRASRLTLITVAVHVSRASEFLRRTTGLLDRASLQVSIMASEEILARRFSRFACTSRVLRECMESHAFSRTAEKEHAGIEALRQGRYQSKLG